MRPLDGTADYDELLEEYGHAQTAFEVAGGYDVRDCASARCSAGWASTRTSTTSSWRT